MPNKEINVFIIGTIFVSGKVLFIPQIVDFMEKQISFSFYEHKFWKCVDIFIKKTRENRDEFEEDKWGFVAFNGQFNLFDFIEEEKNLMQFMEDRIDDLFSSMKNQGIILNDGVIQVRATSIDQIFMFNVAQNILEEKKVKVVALTGV